MLSKLRATTITAFAVTSVLISGALLVGSPAVPTTLAESESNQKAEPNPLVEIPPATQPKITNKDRSLVSQTTSAVASEQTADPEPNDPTEMPAELKPPPIAVERSDDPLPVDWDSISETRLKTLAENGNAEAQHRFAVLLSESLSPPITEDKAKPLIEWQRRAAEQGHKVACRSLGVFYQIGFGVDHDLAEAERWFRAAGQDADGQAETRLAALMLSQGRKQEARPVFESAAEKGSEEAQVELGKLLTTTSSQPSDHQAGMNWLEQAADQGNAEAMALLGDAFLQLNSLPEAVKWYEQAAAKGFAHADYNLGVMAFQQSNHQIALDHFKKAGRRGHVDAAFNAGIVLFQLEEYDASESWLMKAAELGSVDALSKIHVVRRQRDLMERVYGYDYGF